MKKSVFHVKLLKRPIQVNSQGKYVMDRIPLRHRSKTSLDNQFHKSKQSFHHQPSLVSFYRIFCLMFDSEHPLRPNWFLPFKQFYQFPRKLIFLFQCLVLDSMRTETFRKHFRNISKMFHKSQIDLEITCKCLETQNIQIYVFIHQFRKALKLKFTEVEFFYVQHNHSQF